MHAPVFAKITTEIPGPTSRSLCQEESQYLAPGIQQISTLAGLAMAGGEGALLLDANQAPHGAR